jgi:hypothetical protein
LLAPPKNTCEEGKKFLSFKLNILKFNMKFNLAPLFVHLFLSGVLMAQNPTANVGRSCGTQAPGQEWDNWFNQKVVEHNQNLAAGKTASTTYSIPVVVHVIHGGQNVGTYPNITQTQINSQIAVLNADFAGTGLNVGNLAATGFSLSGPANCDITFVLATLDPSGNVMAEPGIDRVNYTTNSWTNPASITSQNSFQNYMDGVIKPGTVWNPIRYANFWVSDLNSNVNLLGYATFPTGTGLTGLNSNFGTASTDGIWVWAKSFGSVGSVQAPYHKGRTTTHELGHWLGLRHIGGDGNGNSAGDCNATDFCNDTPAQKGGFGGGSFGQNFGAPNYPLNANACSSSIGDMFMNFMDYVDDPSCYMFSNNQNNRISTAMVNGTFRKQLTASASTMVVIPSTAPVAGFQLSNSGCVDSLIALNNQSTGSPSPTYSWSINPNNFSGSFIPNNQVPAPNLNFSTSGAFTITLFATNAIGTTSISKVISVTDCALNPIGFEKQNSLQKDLIISPNPTSGFIKISLSASNASNLNIEVRNYLGQIVTEIKTNNTSKGIAELDLRQFADGLYFISVSNGNEQVVKRIILSR